MTLKKNYLPSFCQNLLYEKEPLCIIKESFLYAWRFLYPWVLLRFKNIKNTLQAHALRSTSRMRIHSYMNFPYDMNNDELLKTIWEHKKSDRIVDCHW